MSAEFTSYSGSEKGYTSGAESATGQSSGDRSTALDRTGVSCLRPTERDSEDRRKFASAAIPKYWGRPATASTASSNSASSKSYLSEDSAHETDIYYGSNSQGSGRYITTALTGSDDERNGERFSISEFIRETEAALKDLSALEADGQSYAVEDTASDPESAAPASCIPTNQNDPTEMPPQDDQTDYGNETGYTGATGASSYKPSEDRSTVA